MHEFTKIETDLSALESESQRLIVRLRQEVLRAIANRYANRLAQYNLRQEITRAKRLIEDAKRLCTPAD